MWTLIVRLVALLIVTFSMVGHPALTHTRNRVAYKIDGTYVFVSETITSSRSKTAIREAPEWRGIYIFQNGAYSVSLLKASRNDDWMSSFPKDYTQLGYESEAGTYTLEGSRLTFRAGVSLHPSGYHGSTDFDIQIDGDNLILRSRIPTHWKNIPSGSISTVLRRVSNKELYNL